MVRGYFRIVDKFGACYPPVNTNNQKWLVARG
jgi:hypothetical protein